MAIPITSNAVTLPILEIVQSGKLDGTTIGEAFVTKQVVYRLVAIGGPEVHNPDEIAVVFRWKTLRTFRKRLGDRRGN